jgi:hypothetical protein
LIDDDDGERLIDDGFLKTSRRFVVFTDEERWVVFTDGYVHGKTRVGEAWHFILEKNTPFKHVFSNIIKGQRAPAKGTV